ncbi:SpoIID/LytB domain-containing protein [Austwickia chelonae]|uniref:SpoIID/LytB domain-containing protein n=1 Tax=Austwickia chelonae TaxID=100225 RepID=UPI000E2400A9|nr:SpoIID/LytB domain-containing protein [Austwickia chelonae]
MTRTWQRSFSILLAGTLCLVFVPSQSAQAEESIARPASGQLGLKGHGFGHGRGMSQYGAYGAAQVAGLDHRAILSFYYPGTVLQKLAQDTIRVAINDNDGDTVVEPTEGLTVSGTSGSVTLPTGAEYTRWRAKGTTSVTVEYRDPAGTWKPFSSSGINFGADVVFTSGSGLVRVLLPTGTWQEMRGSVHATAVSGRSRTVLHTPMETYLRGVVPNEMPASWHRQALAAQAVAARTYAAAYRERQRAAGSWYDICDTTTCQVFSGAAHYVNGVRTPKEDARSDAAIVETAGAVLRSGSSPTSPLVHAEFSSSNGGWTVAGPVPYQVAKADPYDGLTPNSPHDWKGTFDASDLDGVDGIGQFRRMVITKRDGRGEWGGRVLTARLEGDRGTTEITGERIRSKLGLRSSWFVADVSAPSSSSRDWTSDGKADIIARDQNGNLTLHVGDGRGAFAEARQVGTGWGSMVEVFAIGNSGSDGRQNLIARHQDGRLFFYIGDGQGSWSGQRQIGHGWTGFRHLVSPGDWNGDGVPDVLAVHAQTGSLVLSAGVGSGLSNPVPIGSGWQLVEKLIAPGDFDGDGKADLIGQSANGGLYLYSGNGQGGFRAQRQIGWGWGGMTAVWSIGDADGDGKSDVLAVDRSGTLRLYPGDGQGGFAAAKISGSGWTGRTPAN